MSPLRFVDPAASKALAFTNRKGDTYYLHAGTTKTGKTRYFFAKTVRDGAIPHQGSQSCRPARFERRFF